MGLRDRLKLLVTPPSSRVPRPVAGPSPPAPSSPPPVLGFRPRVPVPAASLPSAGLERVSVDGAGGLPPLDPVALPALAARLRGRPVLVLAHDPLEAAATAERLAALGVSPVGWEAAP